MENKAILFVIKKKKKLILTAYHNQHIILIVYLHLTMYLYFVITTQYNDIVSLTEVNKTIHEDIEQDMDNTIESSLTLLYNRIK